MRVLVVTSPGFGHVFPTIPLSWALRSAGHEVLYLSTGTGSPVANAGLPVVDVAPGVDVRGYFMNAAKERPELAGGDRLRAMPQEERLRTVIGLFAGVSGLAADGAVEAARHWRADVVVHTPLQGCGPLVAGALGVPAVEHGIGLRSDRSMGLAMAEAMSEHYARQGASAAPKTAVISVGPPSVGGSAHDWSMRYVPYNGSGELADWLLRPVARPRIGVTLGTVSPMMGGLDGLRHVIDAAAEVDAEFVFALGDVDLSSLGALPDNVRAEGWIPLHALLASCSALVHHGGAGTTLTAMCAGVPQIVMPDGADRYANAEAVQQRGVGLEMAAADIKPATLTGLLADADLRTAAQEVRREIEAMPTPTELVGTIREFVG